MSLLLAFLAAAGIDPELEAVMGRRKPPEDRRIKAREEEGPKATIDPELEDCVELARRDSKAAINRANSWIARSNGPMAQQCLGFAEVQGQHWPEAVAAFREGAKLAGPDGLTATRLWAQAGNAALLGGDMAGAVTALDSALAGNAMPDGLPRGEAYLDRARAHGALGDQAGARADLDNALRLAPQDPLAWLLSATLARRMNDLPLAKRHIAEAASRANNDASVALEQGVIAALDVDDFAARTAFLKARRLGAGTPIESAANAYLAQLGENATPAAPTPTTRPAPSR